MMTDEDTDGIQLLTQDGKRQRIFVVGQPEKVIDFIEKVKSHNQDYIEDYNIDEEDNELAQINFKRPISNKQIIKIKKQLSTINIINNGISINNSNNSNSSLKQEEVELLTSNDKYNNLIKLREYFKRPLNKLEQLRTRKRSIHSSSNSNSNRNSSIGSSSNIINSFSSSMGHSTSSSVVLSLQAYEELKQLIDKQRLYIEQKIDQSNAQVIKELALFDSNKNSSDDSSKKIIERINEMIANEGIFEYPELRKALQREGYQDQGILTTFVNNKHYIDTLIEIFKPRNVVAAASSSSQYVQQQQTQTAQQYQQNQQNQQNQQQEIQQYPSFIQQGQQFTVQDEQQQQQQVIEIEDENGYKNSSGNGNINIKQLTQLAQQDDNEINKLSSQITATKIRERSLSPLYHRQKDAQQKSIDNNKKGYEQKMQKQSYSLSNDPTSKPIRLPKSPNNCSPNNNNKSRSITPQKNLLNQ